ncbi:hypothetical protein HCK01_27285, partial [Streptomyces sp. AA8]|nr:hypothetical protein [Streptomyces telluris]
MSDADADSSLDRATDEALALFADDRRSHHALPADRPADRRAERTAHDVDDAPRGSTRAPFAYFPFDEIPVGGGVVDGGRSVGTTPRRPGPEDETGPATAIAPAFDAFPFIDVAEDEKRARHMTADATPHCAPHSTPWPTARAVAAAAAEA